MASIPLEQRVERLERIVEEMRREALRGEPGRDDWQATIGAFSGDPLAEEIIDEALRLRAEERHQAPPCAKQGMTNDESQMTKE